MPRAATLLAILLLAVTAAASRAGGPLAASRKPWDAPPGLSGATFFPPLQLNPSLPGLSSLSSLSSLPGLPGGSTADSSASSSSTGDTLPAATTGGDSPKADSTEAPRGTKDSWTAVGLSAILPGAGQVYTENYWKVPIILVLGGYWVYEWNRNDDKYDEYSDLYNQSIAESPPYGNDQYLQLREAYKDQRDSFAWYLGILYLVNVVDAYVGAELYDFDVGPDLGGGGGAGAYATLRIHL